MVQHTVSTYDIYGLRWGAAERISIGAWSLPALKNIPTMHSTQGWEQMSQQQRDDLFFIQNIF